MHPLLSRIVLVCLLVVDSRSGQPADARRFTLDDLDRLVRLSDPHLSPDGKRVVLVVAPVNLAENRRDAELVEVDVATGAQKVLLRDRRGLSAPRFAPAGDAVAFLAEGEGKTVQLHVLAGEESPRTLTATASGVERFAWSPDGKTLAFSTPDPTEPRTGAERFQDAFEVGNNGFLDRAAPRPSHLWIVPAAGGEVAARDRRAASASRRASPPRRSRSHRMGASWSSRRTIDAALGRHRLRARTRGGRGHRPAAPDHPARRARRHAPAFSPDGAQVVFLHPRDGDPANVNEVCGRARRREATAAA